MSDIEDDENEVSVIDLILRYGEIRHTSFEMSYYFYCPDTTLSILNFVLLIFNREGITQNYGEYILGFLCVVDLEVFAPTEIFSVALYYTVLDA